MRILTTLHLDDPASLKRAIATILTGVALLLLGGVNSFLSAHGLPTIDQATVTAAMGSLAGVVAIYLLQSGANSAIQKQVDGKTTIAAMPEPANVTTVTQVNEAKPQGDTTSLRQP